MTSHNENVELMMESNLRMLKKNIHFLRKKANKMTLDKTAEEVEISRDSIFKLESSPNRYPNLKTVLKISYYYGVNVGDLLYLDLEQEENKKLMGAE